MIQSIWVTTTFIGFHTWPEAPSVVNFLRDLHRHTFHVRLEVLTSTDRQVEFFLLQDQLKDFVHSLGKMLGSWSCEHLCQLINEEFSRSYIVKSITVSEDNENGATLEVL